MEQGASGEAAVQVKSVFLVVLHDHKRLPNQTVVLYGAMCPSKCKGFPALQHWEEALALEMFCLTPEGRVSKTGPGPGKPSKEIVLCRG